jgi:subtilisin family serine protease
MQPRFARNLASGIILLYGLLSLSGTSVEPDFRKVDPRLLHRDAVSTVSPMGATTGAPPAGENAIEVFLRLGEDDPDLPGKFLNLGGNAKRVAPRTYIGEIPLGTIRYVSNWPKIAYIEGSKRVRGMLDVSRPAISADTVQAGTSSFPPPFNTTGFKGDNVYLGFVDTGLYGGHSDFLTSGTGSPSRVVHTYTYSSSIDPLVDVDGHGTHVAGIAAGNGFDSGGTYTGMAPNAAMMIGKSSFTTTNVVTAVQDLVDYAESQTRPVAVNLSLGLVVGPHDGTSGFESAINSIATGASGSRRLIAVAAGNEQDQSEHFRTVVGEPFGTRTVSLNLQSTLSPPAYPQVEIWAYGATRDPDPAKRTEYDEYTVSITFPGDNVTVLSGSTLTSSRGLINVSNRVDTSVPNGATHITISLNHSLAGQAGTIRFDRTRNGGTGVIDGYVDISDGYFPVPEPTGNIIEPANGENVVAVGSFRTKSFSGSAVLQAISTFSSFGPTRDGRLKPDVAAPGEYLYSTRSLDAPSRNYAGIVNNYYAIDRGTSMATPHVTGVAALVWQSNTSLTGARMRERLRRTANLPTDGSTPPNTTWGYGKLNALRAVQNTVASISTPARATPGVPVSLTSENSSAGFGAAISSFLWSAPGASLASPNQSGTTFTAGTPGVYTVSLTATAGGSSGSDSRNILVNTVPTATFNVPPSENAGLPVTFRGSASDPDPQSLAYHWVLVSRPAGSAASITAANVDNAVFTPDAEGTYEIGLRTDDSLDNSALVVHPYTTLNATVAASSSGGGGCMDIGGSVGEAPFGTSLFSVGILLLPACAIGLRRFLRRRERAVPIRHPLC